MEKKPYILSLCSGKGGVGKSILAANLGKTLSEKMKVLIWDADMFFPNQHLIIGIEPPVRLSDVYSGMVTVNTAKFPINSNLDILADKPAVGKREGVKPRILHDVYEQIVDEGIYDFVIIDTPAGSSLELLQCAAISNELAVVITDEPTSLLDAYGLIKLMLPYIDKEKIKLLVNNVIDNEDADDITRKLNLATEKFLGFNLDFLGFIPYDRSVRLSIIQQQLFIDLFPESDVSLSIVDLAQKINDIVNLSGMQ